MEAIPPIIITRNELTLLAHPFIPVLLLCMCGRRPLPIDFCTCIEIKLPHVHILLNHVTVNQLAEKFNTCLAPSLARGPKRRHLEENRLPLESTYGQHRLRMSPFRILQAAISKCTVQSNSALLFFEAAHFSGCWAIANCVSGLSVVSPQVQ